MANPRLVPSHTIVTSYHEPIRSCFDHNTFSQSKIYIQLWHVSMDSILTCFNGLNMEIYHVFSFFNNLRPLVSIISIRLQNSMNFNAKDNEWVQGLRHELNAKHQGKFGQHDNCWISFVNHGMHTNQEKGDTRFQLRCYPQCSSFKTQNMCHNQCSPTVWVKLFNQKSSIFSHALQEDCNNIICNCTHFHMLKG